MGAKLKRHPEYGVTLFVFSGVLSAHELVKTIEMLDHRDSGRWLTYGDSNTSTKAINVADLPELRRVVYAKQKEIFGDVKPRVALVHSSNNDEEFLRFWRIYTLIGDPRPSAPAVFSNLQAACDWLGLPQDACARFAVEVGAPEIAADGG